MEGTTVRIGGTTVGGTTVREGVGTTVGGTNVDMPICKIRKIPLLELIISDF